MKMQYRECVKIQISDYERRFGKYLSLDQVAILTGAQPKIVERLVTLELVKPEPKKKVPVFKVETVACVRRMLRLHYDLGVSWSSMGLVLDLLDRIEKLEAASGE